MSNEATERSVIVLSCALTMASCSASPPVEPEPTPPDASTTPAIALPPASHRAEPPFAVVGLTKIVPMPVSVVATKGGGVFRLTDAAKIDVDPNSPELMQIGQYLADKLRPATGYAMNVREAAAPGKGDIHLSVAAGDPALGDEGYTLTITHDAVALSAYRPAGLFAGVQTLRQLLPPEIERATEQPGPWGISAGTIRDYPRFSWRGMMLDVARHFFPPQAVKRIIDLLAYYKINRFHLHLSDDQGWRIAIDTWPDLALHGGSTEVGGGPGGYFTQADYADIVAYAQSRYVTIVPEIDLPGTPTPPSRRTRSSTAMASRLRSSPAPRSASARSAWPRTSRISSSKTSFAKSPRGRRAPIFISVATRPPPPAPPITCNSSPGPRPSSKGPESG